MSDAQNMKNIKSFLNRRITTKTKFMGEEVDISKLTTNQVMEIQAAAEANKAEKMAGLKMMISVIRAGCPALVADCTDEDFYQLPLDEVSKLSSEIMSYSGMTGDQGKA